MTHMRNEHGMPLCGNESKATVSVLSMVTCPTCRHEQMWLDASEVLHYYRPLATQPQEVATSNNGSRRTTEHTACYNVLAAGMYSKWYSGPPNEIDRYVALRCILVDNARARQYISTDDRVKLLSIACGRVNMTYSACSWLWHRSFENQINIEEWAQWQDFIKRLLVVLDSDLNIAAALELMSQIKIQSAEAQHEVLINNKPINGNVARRLLDTLYYVFGHTKTAIISTSFAVSDTNAVAILEDVGDITCSYSFRLGSKEIAVRGIGRKLIEQAFDNQIPLFFFVEPLKDEMQS